MNELVHKDHQPDDEEVNEEVQEANNRVKQVSTSGFPRNKSHTVFILPRELDARFRLNTC